MLSPLGVGWLGGPGLAAGRAALRVALALVTQPRAFVAPALRGDPLSRLACSRVNSALTGPGGRLIFPGRPRGEDRLQTRPYRCVKEGRSGWQAEVAQCP